MALSQLPLVQTQSREVNQLQNNIKQILDPISSNPLNSGRILKSQSLASGSNVINHGLGRALQGWFLTRQRDVVSAIYDTQDNNPNPNQSLLLTASAPIVVDIYVF